MADTPAVAEADPFELPEWLGSGEVVWTAQSSIHAGHRVTGRLGAGPHTLECDLLAADRAYPRPVLGDAWRTDAHRAWTHGQVLLLEYDGRLTLAVPGTEFTADRVLEALSRLAKAVGAPGDRFLAALRI